MLINETKSIKDFTDASPRASAMIESLRAFGYDLKTALADLADNSIAAGAKNLWFNFYWDGEHSTISLRDDGFGMNESELLEAMRPGSKSPTDIREKKDLGRFGLGLKTASFSQCRQLTVKSCKGGKETTRCWDLDYVVLHNEWRLQHKAPERAENELSSLPNNFNGTIVLWQNIDRLVADTLTQNQDDQARFLDALTDVEKHLGMIFHDYINPSAPGLKSIKFWINGRQIKAWDPFLSSHSYTQPLPEESLLYNGERIKVTPYVLPHHQHLDPETFRDASGTHGWNAHQGFYIYRNRRLLVAGDWLELGFVREEHYKLTRIRVDLPNNFDEDWQLDVKKSRATPPTALRNDLKRIAISTRSAAQKVYRYRGAKLTQSIEREHVFLWLQKQKRGKIFYSLNRGHPLIKSVIASCEDKKAIRALLRLCEETIPLPLIINSPPEQLAEPFEQSKSADIAAVLRQAYEVLLKVEQLTPKQAKLRLMQIEPFNRFPELVETVADLPDSFLETDPESELEI